MYLKIKISGVYKIEHQSGHYYIGQSSDIINRWSSHMTDLYMNKHSSIKFQQLWNTSKITEWIFIIERTVSKTLLKTQSKLKGKEFEAYLRKELLREEKEVMKLYSRDKSLNKQNKSFNENNNRYDGV